MEPTTNRVWKHMKKRQEKRSPIDAPPLRSAGQSIEEEIQRLIVDDYWSWAMIAGCVIGIAIFETIKWYGGYPPQPIVAWGFAIICCVFWAIKFSRLKKKAKNLRLAKDGEKVVGEYLERFRADGYKIFHDVVGEGFNIDHVLIGPAGVFTIETKTISKPAKGKAEIEYDGEKITVNGFQPDRDPIVQSKAQASWLKNLIKESTGKNVDVKPLVLYPGWYIRFPSRKVKQEVFVLNPRCLAGFLDKARERLAIEDTNPDWVSPFALCPCYRGG